MKEKLKIHFLPVDYKQCLFKLYHNCKQGNKTMEEYAKELIETEC